MSSSIEISKSARIHILIGAYFSNMFDFFDLMLLSVCLPFIMTEFNLSLAMAGFLGTATLVGNAVSSFFWGWFSDNKGRKPAMILSIISFSLLTGLLAFTANYGQFLFIRFLGGVALGGLFSLVGTLITETWPAHLRARATSITMTSSVVGSILAALISKYWLAQYGWRAMFLLPLFGLLIAAYVYIFVPESPVWKNRKNEQIVNQKALSFGEGLKEILSGIYLKRTVFGVLGTFFAQLCYWGFIFWLPTFLVEERGLDASQYGSFLMLALVGSFVGLPLGGWLADRFGRKKTLVTSFVVGGILLPLYASVQNLTLLYYFGPFLFLIWLYGGIVGAYYAELYPTHVRVLGATICWAGGRGLSAIGPYTLAVIGTMYSLQTSISLCGVIYLLAAVCFMLLPETHVKKENKDLSANIPTT